MDKAMMTPEETATLIRTGRFLSLAAAEPVLRRLPTGNWIGGTIPYFIGETGGLQSSELVHVADLAAPGCAARILEYGLDDIAGIAGDAPENGFTMLLIPAMSPLHFEYAAHSSDYPDLFMKPIIGWVSGVHLDDLGKVSPKVVNGQTGRMSDERAVALHVALPPDRMAIVRILNLFHQGTGDVLVFPLDGFKVSECLVNGKPANFAKYVQDRGLDTSCPLVADYNGAQVNISFQAVDAGEGHVQFYAPVFAGIEYRHAAPVGDYVKEFDALTKGRQPVTPFACNCILNYLYGKLEGRRTGQFTGPVTFGEIAYQLLNQTLVYLEIIET